MLLLPGAVGLWLVTGGRGLAPHPARMVALVAAVVGGLAAVVASVISAAPATCILFLIP